VAGAAWLRASPLIQLRLPRQCRAAQRRADPARLAATAPSDGILMIPVSGFDVVGVEDGHCFAARTPDGTMSWRLDVEPRDRHSRRLISRWRAQWHITRSVRSGSRRPTPETAYDQGASRAGHTAGTRPPAAEPQGADPRSPRRQSSSLTSSGNAHIRTICTGEPAQRPITTRANIRQGDCFCPRAYRTTGALTLRSRLIISWASAAGSTASPAPDVHRDTRSLRSWRHRVVLGAAGCGLTWREAPILAPPAS
jgi:hypothetical protein